nr:hypothetical protein [uncultured bacterium]AMP54399.1 hypothetical protein [uncultured bacterium]
MDNFREYLAAVDEKLHGEAVAEHLTVSVSLHLDYLRALPEYAQEVALSQWRDRAGEACSVDVGEVVSAVLSSGGVHDAAASGVSRGLAVLAVDGGVVFGGVEWSF